MAFLKLVRAIAADQKDRTICDVSAQVVDEAKRERIGPLQVFEHDDQGSRRTDVGQSLEYRLVGQCLGHPAGARRLRAVRYDTTCMPTAATDRGRRRRQPERLHGGAKGFFPDRP